LQLFKDNKRIVTSNNSYNGEDIDLSTKKATEGYHTFEISSSGEEQYEGLIKFCLQPDELQLGEWTKGEILRPYGSDWKYVEVPFGMDTLFVRSEGFGMWSTIEVFADTLNNPEDKWLFGGSGWGYSITGKIPQPKRGKYYIRYTDSAVITGKDDIDNNYQQKREYLFLASASAAIPPSSLDLRITKLSSFTGSPGIITLTITGSGFTASDSVKLMRTGNTSIPAQVIQYDSTSRNLLVTFDLSGASTGDWDLIVVQDNGKQAVAPKSFTVVENQYPDIQLEILGRSNMRIGRQQPIILKCANLSSIDTKDVFIKLEIPDNIQAEVNLPIYAGYGYNVGLNPDNDIYLLIPKLAANSTAEYEVNLFTSELNTYEIKAKLQHFAVFDKVDTTKTLNNLSGGSNTKPRHGDLVFARFVPKGLENAPCFNDLKNSPLHVGIYTEELGESYVYEFLSSGQPNSIKFEKWKAQPGFEFRGSWSHANLTDEIRDKIAKIATNTWLSDLEDYDNDHTYALIPLDPIYMATYKCILAAIKARIRKLKPKDIKECVEAAIIVGGKKRVDNSLTWVSRIYADAGIDLNTNPFTPPCALINDCNFECDTPILDKIPNNAWQIPSDILIKAEEYVDNILKEFTNSISHTITAVGSLTPEDKYGPVGHEQIATSNPANRQHFISTKQEFEYKIDYWNKETATAPASIVYIRDTLDTDFNLSTLQFTEVGFLDKKIQLEGGQSFDVTVDMRPAKYILVNVKGTLNPRTRELFWVHTTLDPITLELPDDPESGYLPPIDTAGFNIGWVKFKIKPNENLPNHTVITNQARVNFDGIGPWGPAPPYGPYTNTLDLEPPASHIIPLPATTTDTTFIVSWSGSDTGSGVVNHDVYVSVNNSSYKLWQLNTSLLQDEFTGKIDSTYAFYSIAKDYAGNIEGIKTTAEATTTVVKRVTGLPNKLPDGFAFKTYPNPTENKVLLEFTLPAAEQVSLVLYDVLGRRTTVIKDKKFAAGTHTVPYDLKQFPAGMYICELQGKKFTTNLKILKQ